MPKGNTRPKVYTERVSVGFTPQEMQKINTLGKYTGKKLATTIRELALVRLDSMLEDARAQQSDC